MSDNLTKLRPDRDLQCYFSQPSAVAALSDASAAGFTISGSWRQQFDWAVLEWNRDNVFEHPAFRNLPDGDLSFIRLSYDESRSNCIPIDSTLYPTVDWPYLRLWADEGPSEVLYRVPLKEHATPFGDAAAPTAEFQLSGTISGGDYIELAWLDHHYNYYVLGSDTLENAAKGLADIVTANQSAGQVSAVANGTRITLTWLGTQGSNGNRIGVYGTVSGARTESWSPTSAVFQGGSSPGSWHIELDFGNLSGYRGTDLSTLVTVPTSNVRKLRWTWAADFQPGEFQRSDFSVRANGWTVTGGKIGYLVAGPGSRRIEDDSPELAYRGAWVEERGNYSGGSIHHSVTRGDSIQCSYSAPLAHELFLGTRYVSPDGIPRQNLKYEVTVQVDSGSPTVINLRRDGEDVLVRYPLGQFTGVVSHTVTVTNSGDTGADVYFDFLEAAVPTTELPRWQADAKTTLATDWDTAHSLAIAPERTAWILDWLGFRGRANHYAGALWFYELHRPGHRYASGTIAFSGMPEFGKTTTVSLAGTPITHLNLVGDTAESVATCFALVINSGWTSAWARADGATLTITARAMGTAGNGIGISADTGGSSVFSCSRSGPHLDGGIDAPWITDSTVTQRLNRAARDWTRSFFRALKGFGIEPTAAFSMELGNGDDSTAASIAQRYPDASPVWVNTPALQTNFSPQSLAFWQQAYLDMATVMVEAGVNPYLQFGEVQWWYFAGRSGMTFYDAYTTGGFQSRYGRPMAVIASEHADPSGFAEECSFLAELIGEFTSAVMTFVRQAYPATRFEVLYPPDTNDTPLNRLVNFPADHWTPANLGCLKTENFTYTGDRNLDKARESISVPAEYGFPPSQSSHLIGIGDTTTPWSKERSLTLAAGLESVVLFALDQFCLIGLPMPLTPGIRRARLQGR